MATTLKIVLCAALLTLYTAALYLGGLHVSVIGLP